MNQSDTLPVMIQFGAGNIGRSFIGQLFACSNYHVVFIDIDPILINALNTRKSYTIQILDTTPYSLTINHVSGILATDSSAIIEKITQTDIIATAVGVHAFPHIFQVLAQGILKRWEKYPNKPLDIIICENLRNATGQFLSGISDYLPPEFPTEKLLGVVETSIGKMVPLALEAQKAEDPLVVYAEAYNTLLVDKQGFKGPIPNVAGLEAKDDMKAYVDRKLFIHNLGHAGTAYLGYLFGDYTYIWEAINHPTLYRIIRNAMDEAAQALIAEYPDSFTESNQQEHIQDLLQRFGNKQLGDTVYRVGRDISRKISPEDRIVGALKLCLRHSIPYTHIAFILASALFFKATDEQGVLFPPDEAFHTHHIPLGLPAILTKICHLDSISTNSTQHAALFQTLETYYQAICKLGTPPFSIEDLRWIQSHKIS